MGFNLGSMFVEIGAKTSKLKKGLKHAEKLTKETADKLTSIGSTLSVAFTAPLLAVGAASIKMSADMEQSRIAFETLAGGAIRSRKLLDELFEFALKTPFTFVGLQDSAKRLIAMGFNAQQIIPTMQSLGDAVAAVGGGQETIDRVATALGQMQAKGKVSAEEMKQLAEAGIPAWQLLADTLKTTVADAMKQVERRTVNSGEAIAGLLAGISKKFGGLMKKQVNTVTGRLSIMRDQINKILIDIGDDLTEAFDLKDKIKNFTEGIKTLNDEFLKLSSTTKSLIFSFGVAIAIVGPLSVVLGGLAFLASALTAAFGLSLGTFGLIAAGIVILIASGIALILNWEKLKSVNKVVWVAIENTILGRLLKIAKVLAFFNKNIPLTGKLWQKTVDFLNESIASTVPDIPPPKFDKSGFNEEFRKMMTSIDKFGVEIQSSLAKFGIKVPVENQEAIAIFKQLGKNLEFSALKAKLLGDSFNEAEAEASLLTAAIEDLLKAKVSPDDPRLLKLSERLKSITKDTVIPDVIFPAPPEIDPITSAMENMGKQIQIANDKFSLMGTNFDLNGEKAAILQQAINSLMEEGIRPGDEQLQGLIDRLAAVREAMDQTSEKIPSLTDKIKQGFKKMGAAGVQFAQNMAINLVTGASSWKTILQGFLNTAVRIIIEAAFKAMSIAKLVSEAMDNMFNPLGFIVIGGLLVALAAISSGLSAKTASAATGGGGGGGAETPAPDTIPDRVNTRNVIFINGNLVDMAQLSRELEPYNVELQRDTI